MFERFYKTPARAFAGFEGPLGLAIIKRRCSATAVAAGTPTSGPLERRFTCCSGRRMPIHPASRCDGWRSTDIETLGGSANVMQWVSVHARNLVVQLLLKATPVPVHAWQNWPVVGLVEEQPSDMAKITHGIRHRRSSREPQVMLGGGSKHCSQQFDWRYPPSPQPTPPSTHEAPGGTRRV